jgi:hypothetical protein
MSRTYDAFYMYSLSHNKSGSNNDSRAYAYSNIVTIYDFSYKY